MFKHLEKLHADKNETYGEAYTKFGYLMHILFPKGITLKSPEDFIKFGIYTQWIEKVMRVGHIVFGGGKENFESVMDSCDDLAIVAQMLKKELKNESNNV